MDAAFASLEREYCPPLDPALFAAIVSDFDLNDNEAINTARETLDVIKASAVVEESAGFDPSGNASREYGTATTDLLETTEQYSEAGASQSHETDLTSLSNDTKSLSLHSDANDELRTTVLADSLDDASKIALLNEMFPESTEFAISHTLSKCGGSWDRALEELLNHTFFSNGGNESDPEDKINAKGIEAFSEDHILRRGRKKKQSSYRKTLREELTPRSSSLPDSARANPWERTKHDIDFLAARTNTTRKKLSSLYHQNGASLHATIYALINVSLVSGAAQAPLDENVQANVNEFAKDFPSLSTVHLTELIRLAQPSTAAAHELAKALTCPEPGTGGQGGIEVIPRYAPIRVDSENDTDDPGGWVSPQPRTARSSGTATPTYAGASMDPAAQANQYMAAQQRSFAQAAAAYRRGRSDHLMSAAAGYYSQQGRDFAMKRAEATADAADALVQSQSSKEEIDLHGVSVKDAVRISKTAVQLWWRERRGKVKGLDGRVSIEDDRGSSRSQVLRIVTGVGRHSSGGKGKIGPAVGRMLASEGWNFRAEEGVLTVYGKMS